MIVDRLISLASNSEQSVLNTQMIADHLSNGTYLCMYCMGYECAVQKVKNIYEDIAQMHTDHNRLCNLLIYYVLVR